MKKYQLFHLEMHVADACNMKCNYCGHFCNYNYGGGGGGIIPYEIGYEWMRLWSKRLAPQRFRLLGGEPLLNHDLAKYIRAAADFFPDADRDVVTNGLLLAKNEHIFPVLIETNTSLTVSLHPTNADEEKVLYSSLELAFQWKDKGLKLGTAETTRRWTRNYQGEGKEIRPFCDGDPQESFTHCIYRFCRNIYQEKLYHCPPLAYLPMIVDQLSTKEEWTPYLAYKGLAADASDGELEAVIAGDKKFCGMCPASTVYVPEGQNGSPFQSAKIKSLLAARIRRDLDGAAARREG